MRLNVLGCTELRKKDQLQCGKEGVVIYRRLTDPYIHVVCVTHDTETRKREAERLGYERHTL